MPQFLELSFLGGDDGIRTHDPLLAGQVLSQLSYTPIFASIGRLGCISFEDSPSKSNNKRFGTDLANHGFIYLSTDQLSRLA